MLLLRPFFLKCKNIFLNLTLSSDNILRFILLLGFTASIPFFLYRGMSWVLLKTNEDPSLSILPASLFLGMILGFLQLILIVPSLFLALGNYYLAEDLELLLASPLRLSRFFFGRLIGVIIGSSWMPFIFLFPVLLALWESTMQNHFFALNAVFILVPFFVIPSALAVVLATLMTYLMPAHRARYVSQLLFLAALLGLIFIIQTIDLGWTNPQGSKELLRILKFFEIGQNPWLPSTWAAKAMEQSMNAPVWFSSHSVLLYCVMLASISLAFLTILLMHPQAYSYAKARHQKPSAAILFVARALSGTLLFLPSQLRAIIKKEAKVISRDIGQTVQLLVLCVLALIYLYNIRMFSVLDSVPGSMATWWRTFLFLGNLCMGAFLTTSICTRLVFPSISMEGRAIWMLQTAPIDIKSVMQAKLICWLVPVGLVSFIFFVAGAIAIGGDIETICVSGLLSLILCYGIVGLAVGLGACFAKFDWEHPSQLSASLGSMIFMVSAILLVFMNMLPAWFLLAGQENYAPSLGLNLYQAVAVLTVCSLGINTLIVREVFKSGEKKLLRINN